jgi:hypothetical protein
VTRWDAFLMGVGGFIATAVITAVVYGFFGLAYTSGYDDGRRAMWKECHGASL